jgi:hypothetical protein
LLERRACEALLEKAVSCRMTSMSAPSEPLAKLKSWLRLLGVDRAIANSIVLKIWQVIAGLAGLALIASYFSKETQGFYYTFASLIALQSFIELGLNVMVSNFVSHEWSKLRISRGGAIEGDPHALSRLVSLGRFAFKWYLGGTVVFLLGIGSGGYWFLSQAAASGVDWQGPWMAHVAFSAIIFWSMPFFALLEGCDQVAQVVKFRTYQAVASNIAIWLAILSDAALWAAPAYSITAAIFAVCYLLFVRRPFARAFFKPPSGKRIHWRAEILPMQWRLALQGLTNYFTLSLFTPVMFYYHGPVVAGQMGMSWQIVSAIQSTAAIWVVTKTPRFGILVVERQFFALDSKWRQATVMSILLMLCGVLTIFLAIEYLSAIDWHPVHRVLPPLAFLLLAAGGLFSHAIHSIAIYLRAHKREMLTPVALTTGVLMAITVWQAGMRYGPSGAAAAYLLVLSAVSFPMAFLIWRRCRREWHD